MPRALGIVPLSLALLIMTVAATTYSGTCNLGCTPCATLCDGGCPAPVTVRHGAPACAVGGAFNLIGTGYESTCTSGAAGCPIDQPPIRLWQFDDYSGANAGCSHVPANALIGNASLDLGQPVPDGHWVLDRFDWTGADIDGCVATGGATPSRMVAEMSFPDVDREGTIGHRGLYLIASVPEVAGGFDFDGIQGATGCNGADVAIAEVPAPGILPFPLGPTRLNGVDPRFFDVRVALPATPPDWFTEAGRGADPALVAGYQVMYSGEPEPITSASCAWQPVFDPGDPRLVLGVVPLNSPEVVVSIPGSCYLPSLERYWLALRLVYVDTSVNPTAPFDPTAVPGPSLTSAVGSHVGPVQAPYPFEPPIALAAKTVWPQSSVPPGAPVIYNFPITGYYYTFYGVVLTDLIPDCLDDRDFDPDAKPWQITLISPPPLPVPAVAVSYDRATRNLVISAYGSFNHWQVDVQVRGLYAAFDDPACCNSASYDVTNPECGLLTLTTGPACVAIDSSIACVVKPEIVRNLRAVKDPVGAVTLSWDRALDTATVAYDVWKLTSSDPSGIPLANKDEWPRSGDLASVCLDEPVTSPVCVDWYEGQIDPDPPLVFYQARGVCSDGSEGTAHPY